MPEAKYEDKYNVLIADDELLTMLALKCFIPWEKHSFSVVAEAHNG